MRVRFRPIDYVTWALALPGGARFDLSASGVPDSVPAELPPPSETEASLWPDHLELPAIARREHNTEVFSSFVQAVADRYTVDTDAVVPSLGANQSIMQALFTLARSGDHVIVERPTYEPLHRVPELLGLDVSRLERTAEEGWAVVPDRLAKLLTPRTRAVVLSNLHNPSGVAIPTEALQQIGEMAARVGAFVLVDEVYLDFCFDPRPDSPWLPACLALDNGVSWSSANKVFGLNTARAGWMVTRDPELSAALRSASHYFQLTVPLASARLGRLALERADALQNAANQRIKAARRVLDRWVESETRVSWTAPTAGQTCLLRLPPLMQDHAFTEHLRERYDTQVVPGSFFEAPGYVRVSFGISPGELEQALANFSAALDDLS